MLVASSQILLLVNPAIFGRRALVSANPDVRRLIVEECFAEYAQALIVETQKYSECNRRRREVRSER
jgi:hypothetical protein